MSYALGLEAKTELRSVTLLLQTHSLPNFISKKKKRGKENIVWWEDHQQNATHKCGNNVNYFMLLDYIAAICRSG
jgi:hypothetical protein